MKLWVLGSGSRGNALLLEDGPTRLLVDAGFPARVLAARLATIGVDAASITAVVITHEHTDHVRGAPRGARRWRWPVYATAGTISASPQLAAIGAGRLSRDEPLRIDTLELDVIPVSHDAAEPVALVVRSQRSGCSVGIAHDLGRAGPRLRAQLRELDMLVIESNHDGAMLRSGPYPLVVQDRIAGVRGHLSNDSAAEVVGDVAHVRLQHIVLAHLSENCNTPQLAMDAMRTRLKRTRFRGRVQLTWQDKVVGPLEPAPRAAVQLGLAL